MQQNCLVKTKLGFMQTTAVPLFEPFSIQSSCVLETRFSVIGLYIVVEAYRLNAKRSSHIEVYFPQHRGFVLLDEGDMPSWLSAQCFKTNHLVFEVTGGGWFDRRPPEDGLLAIACASSKEWLVVTANECVSVFSEVEPIIRDISA